MSNITSLSDIRKKQENNDEKKRNELFIGGINQQGGGSGLAVEGPPSSNTNSNIFDSLIKRASNTEDGSDSKETEGNNNHRHITMYNNGFTVDNEPLRDLVSPNNVAFLNSLQRGEVPQELLRQLPHSHEIPRIDIHLVDERPKDYVPPPPPAYTAFSGGSTLGSVSNSTLAYRFTPTILSQINTSVIDDSKLTTIVQVRCANGKKIKIKINKNASVLQLAAMILRDGDDQSGQDFILSSGFPHKDVTCENISIEEAGLVGAAITQKLV